jgi:hypothetical protein
LKKWISTASPSKAFMAYCLISKTGTNLALYLSIKDYSHFHLPSKK